VLIISPQAIDFVESRVKHYGFDQPCGIAIIKNDKLIGGVVFDNYRPSAKTVSVSIALDDKRALDRESLRLLFDYGFNQLQCNRMTTMIDSENDKSIKLCSSLGFVQEGCLRSASPTGNDLVIFGMLKEECKWLFYKDISGF